MIRPTCPLCAGSATVESFRKGVFHYRRCRTCSHIFVFPLPTAQQNAAYYGQSYNEGYLHQNRGWFECLGTRRMNLVTHYRARPGRLLDIGSGYGFFLQEASRRGWNAVGLEAARAPADFAASQLGVRVIRQPVEQALFELQPNSFDFVTFWHVLEHLEEPGLVLREAVSKVKPGGYLAINSPNMASAIYKLVGGLWSWIYTPGHLQYFSLESLSRWLQRQGLSVVDEETWTDAPNLYFLIEEAMLVRLKEVLEVSASSRLRIRGNRLSDYLNTPQHTLDMQFRLNRLYQQTPLLDRWIRRRKLGHEFLVLAQAGP